MKKLLTIHLLFFTIISIFQQLDGSKKADLPQNPEYQNHKRNFTCNLNWREKLRSISFSLEKENKKAEEARNRYNGTSCRSNPKPPINNTRLVPGTEAYKKSKENNRI